jgi:hypothetical protein
VGDKNESKKSVPTDEDIEPNQETTDSHLRVARQVNLSGENCSEPCTGDRSGF